MSDIYISNYIPMNIFQNSFSPIFGSSKEHFVGKSGHAILIHFKLFEHPGGGHSLRFMVTMCVRRVESMIHYRVILCLKMTPFTVNSSKNIYPFTVLPFCQPLEVQSKIFIMHFFYDYNIRSIDPFL